ncbi:MAG: hypothetical protein V4614_02620 [Pseudomonadota bacterium]
MNAFLKTICAVVLFVSGSGIGFAQAVEQIKSDDVLKWKIVALVALGQGFVDGGETAESATVKVDAPTGERLYIYAKENSNAESNGVTLRKSRLFGILQRNRYVFAKDEAVDVIPEKFSIGDKWKEVVWINRSRCGRGKSEYDVTVSAGPQVVVKIRGIPTTLTTFEIAREGTWFNPRCGGSGGVLQKILFSPQINEIVSHESRTIDKGVPYVGERKILDSVD